ncbi:hypothetical protein V501_09979 [Pseudogymnoascus sp. VKM F-4519 (FW-2642)]|nr:hypothetical protein V501_09979 [Pseudogymnoascus sp. VKM F-4519 (FW-2642)]
MSKNHVVKANLFPAVYKIIAMSDRTDVSITSRASSSSIYSLLAMSNSLKAPSCALPPHLAAWRSLVSRSIAAWDDLAPTDQTIYKNVHLSRSILEECHSLDNFFNEKRNSQMFWFFQQRTAFMSQRRMKKWSRNELNDYVLLPASLGFVSRRDCFFVSHFWQTQEDPDPGGEYLRLHQAELKPQTWSYIWVDWTCMPQSPRLPQEEAYFSRCLGTMSGIIRNSGFIYFYPPFQPRLWILYEITEFAFTSSGGILATPDIKLFLKHIDEMLTTGVQATLAKHGYRCSCDHDRLHLTSWLELLVLLQQLHLGIDTIRKIMDGITWQNLAHTHRHLGVSEVELKRFEGTLVVNGKTHRFSSFPQ